MSPHEELEDVVRSSRVTTTEARDEQIVALAEAHLARARGKRKLARALMVAAVVLIVASIGFVIWNRDREPTGSGDTQLALETGTEHSLPKKEEPRNDALRLGWPRTVGIDETLRASVLVAKLELTSEIANGTVHAKVLQVLKGEAKLLGAAIKVHSNPYSNVLPISARTFLCAQSMTYIEKVKGSCWLVPLKKKGQDYRNSFSEGLHGTRVPKARTAKKGAKPEGAVRDELLAALDAKSAAIRHDAISALRNWNGMNLKKPSDRLWKDPKVAARLLRVARDPDERVRWTLAWMIPESAGAAGEKTLFRLLFDPVRMVRQPASHHLKKRGHDEIADALKQITDYQLDERLGKVLTVTNARSRKFDARGLTNTLKMLATHQQWQIRADQAWQLGQLAATEKITTALLLALDEDEHFEVRRWACWSLGRVSEKCLQPNVVKALTQHATSDDEDGRVRVMAATSLHGLGNGRGYDLLVAFTKGKDTRAAVQSLETLAASGTKQVLDVLLAATKDEREVVRAFATAHLHRCQRFARHQINAKLTDLTKDKSPLVRAAVEVACEKMLRVR